MDSFEFTKIAGAVLSALLLIVGAKTVIEANLNSHSATQEVAGYTLEGGDDEQEAPASTTKAAATEMAASPTKTTTPAQSATATPAQSATSAATTSKPAASGFDPAKVVAMIASADATGGKKVFKKCKGCHNAKQGAGAKSGPNLWGIVDRPKASFAGFGYSQSMKDKGGTWTLEDLASFLHKPKSFISKTKMVFRGIKKDGDIAKLLAYLSSLK